MKQRKKPSQSWIESSKYEIENADRLLAERQEQLKNVREMRGYISDYDGYPAPLHAKIEQIDWNQIKREE